MARIADSGCAACVTKDQPVVRPQKKNEYLIVFGSRASRKGWTDLKATKLNALVDAWDFRTLHSSNPTRRIGLSHSCVGRGIRGAPPFASVIILRPRHSNG